MKAILVFLTLVMGCSGDQPSAGDVVEDLGLAPPLTTAESASISIPPARDNNTVRLLINGEASFAERMRMVAEAKESIYIQALIFKADTTGRAITEALIARKRADPQLDIRVIVDTYANVQDVDAQLMYFDLQNAGIDVEGFEAFYLHWLNEINLKDWLAGNKRYHEKYWIIDNKEAVVGGMNIADEYARCSSDPMLLWRDQDVLLAGPVVEDIQRAFLDNYSHFKDIKSSKGELLNPDTYWELWREKTPGAEMLEQAEELKQAISDSVYGEEASVECTGTPVPTQTREDVNVRFIRARPREGERYIHELYLEQINGAKKSIFIENAYFVPIEDLTGALSAAARRGVQVQVVTNSDKTNDIPMITIAGRARYQRLIEAGVEVYEWHAEKFGEGTVHSKYAVFDDQIAVIGSYNLDPRSIGLNSEDVVVIDDPATAQELVSYSRDRDLALAERITPEEAAQWVDPITLPVPPEKHLPWHDPRFDPKTFEYFLLRQIEGSL